MTKSIAIITTTLNAINNIDGWSKNILGQSLQPNEIIPVDAECYDEGFEN